MFELILIGEFGEEMQDINSCLEELVRVVRGFAPSGMSISEVDDAVRELSRCAAPVLREHKPRRMHPKHRPPRTREGFPRRWVVPQL